MIGPSAPTSSAQAASIIHLVHQSSPPLPALFSPHTDYLELSSLRETISIDDDGEEEGPAGDAEGAKPGFLEEVSKVHGVEGAAIGTPC